MGRVERQAGQDRRAGGRASRGRRPLPGRRWLCLGGRLRPPGGRAASLIRGLSPFLAVWLLAGACNGDLAGRPPGPIVPGTAADPRAVNVILRDYVFVPTPILLVPGETVRFQIIDGGLVDHEFVLGPEDLQAAYESADAAAAPSLPGTTPRPVSLPAAVARRGLRIYLHPGQEMNVVYRVPSRGPAPLLECHIPGHVAKGMVGKVVYVAPGATGP